jgi:Arc/MetJ-type ribon-helix-helix transcriptional regulator
MPIVTIPLEADLLAFIEEEIRVGNAETKTQVVRQALRRLRDERAFARLREAESDIREGRLIKGDLRALLDKLPE